MDAIEEVRKQAIKLVETRASQTPEERIALLEEENIKLKVRLNMVEDNQHDLLDLIEAQDKFNTSLMEHVKSLLNIISTERASAFNLESSLTGKINNVDPINNFGKRDERVNKIRAALQASKDKEGKKQ